MRYWAYMNNQVLGPFEKDKLPGIPNFTLSSLICPETAPAGQAPGWKEASAYPEVLAVFGPAPAPAPAQPRRPAAESPLAMTMRGTLIEEPVIDEPASAPAPAAAPAAESPFGLTMRGSLISDPVTEEPVTPAPAPGAPAAAQPAPANSPARPQPQPDAQTLEQVRAALLSVAETQSRLLGRLDRLEGAVADMKALLSPQPPKRD